MTFERNSQKDRLGFSMIDSISKAGLSHRGDRPCDNIIQGVGNIMDELERKLSESPEPGSQFIHSMSEPFSEEDIEDQVMHNWINHFKMHFHQLHASGHLNKNQLVGLINYVEPKRVFPVHTENQQLFKDYCNNVQTIEHGKEYVL
jgi:hypothetical protein